jgi:hypothetical protein
MQTLALENYGVVEMETTEKEEVDGGTITSWFDFHLGWWESSNGDIVTPKQARSVMS